MAGPALCRWHSHNDAADRRCIGSAKCPLDPNAIRYTSVVAPDGALVTQESWDKLSTKERERFFSGAPAVAVELCSDSDNPNELRAKLERIRHAGASYVVRIDPYRSELWTAGTPPAAFDVDFEQLLQ
jgi:Uma2 family endonuclease